MILKQLAAPLFLAAAGCSSSVERDEQAAAQMHQGEVDFTPSEPTSSGEETVPLERKSALD